MILHYIWVGVLKIMLTIVSTYQVNVKDLHFRNRRQLLSPHHAQQTRNTQVNDMIIYRKLFIIITIYEIENKICDFSSSNVVFMCFVQGVSFVSYRQG